MIFQDMQTEMKVLTSNDLDTFIALIALFEEVFEMEDFVCPSKIHLSTLLAKEDFRAIVALSEGQVLGGLTLYFLPQYYAHKPLAYLYDLAVKTEFQRQGIGKQLMTFTQQYCKKAGFEEIFVQADKVDVHALNFYRATDPTGEEDVSHFYYRL